MRLKGGIGKSGKQRHRQQNPHMNPQAIRPAQKIAHPHQASNAPKDATRAKLILEAQEAGNGKRRQEELGQEALGRPPKRSRLDAPAALDEHDQEDSGHSSTFPFPSATNTPSNASDINVTSGTKIEAKVTRILETLAGFSNEQSAVWQANVVSLSAKGPAVAKLISIVEIAKRQMFDQNRIWYQYSQLHSTKEEMPRKKTISEVDASEEEEEERAFVAMKTPIERALEGTPKVRAVPLIKVYLSNVSIGVLKTRCGEQTSAQPPEV